VFEPHRQGKLPKLFSYFADIKQPTLIKNAKDNAKTLLENPQTVYWLLKIAVGKSRACRNNC